VRCVVEQGCKVVIVSGDKDLLQLVSEDITLWDPMNDRLMDAAAVEEKYGFGPKQLLDYFALVGDSSDNISGVPGVGPKTALKLLAEYETLEGLYAQIDGLKKSKMKERLIAHKDDAFLSRDLVRLEEKAEVVADLQAYQVGEADPDTLRDLLTELEFFTLLKSDVPAAKVATEGFVLVRQREELEQLVELIGKQLQGAGHLVVDTETTSLDPLEAELVGISLCTETNQAWYLPCGHRDAAGELLPDQLTVQDIVDLLGPLLTDPALAKIGHNLKYDYAILAAPQNGGIRLAGLLYDTMLGAWLLEPGRRSYKLDDLCQKIDLKLTPFSEIVDGDKAPDAFCRVAPEVAKDYSCEDVFGSLRLFEEQRPELEKQELWTLFSEVEGMLIPVLAAMEETGILLDKEVLQGLTKEFGVQLDELEQEIYELAGHAFNINSSQQLAEVLFDELGLPKGRKTKTGYSTDVKVLEKLSH
ncbi:MAG: DNA polymerase I, partial [Candidatus Electrothrix sp. MAN1_4]|nr:DNA polymerase I [Candidatus Electrothrix sp. MAN1_4]